MANTHPGASVPSSKASYFAWRTIIGKRDSTPDIDSTIELLLREAWSVAYDLGRKDGVTISARLRQAADAYIDFFSLVERWEQEKEALALVAEEATA